MTKLSRIFAVATACFFIANIVPTLTLKAGYKDLHVYNYKAEISVGVEEPANYISKYSVHGLLKVQRDVDQVSVSQYKYLIALTDVKYDSYYGEDAIRISKYEAVDEKVLGNAFTAFYKASGQLKSVVFDKNEPQWSKKIKKSIASLLQFDWSVVKDVKKTGKVHVVPVEESTIHGKCFVNYNSTLVKSVSNSQTKINLKKTIYPTKCNKFVSNFNGYGTNDEASINAIKNRLDHKQTKIESAYDLEIIKNQLSVKKIFNFEKYRYDFDTDEYSLRRNPLFVKVRQTLFLKKTDPGHEFLQKSENVVAATKNTQDVIVNQKQLISKVKKLLLEVNQYLKENRLVEINPGAEHRQLFNRIHHYMKDFDTDSYEFLYNDIRNMKNPEAESTRRIFIQMIPYVGTKSSLLFIKSMVITKKVSDSDAISLVSNPTYTDNVDKVLPDLEIFLQKDNGLSPEVQQKAFQSFSHLLSKVCQDNLKTDDASIKKYIRSIYESMKEATTMDAKLAYLTALGNTQCQTAIKYIKGLLPRQKKDSKDTVRIRMLAIFILTPLIGEDDADVLEKLTKILYDKNETKELRIEAYKVLVQKSNFDAEDFIDIGRLMSTDEHLYNYHVTTMRIFNKLRILSNDTLSKIESTEKTLQPLILGNEMLEFNSTISWRIAKRFFTRDSSKRTFLRAACVREFDLSLSLASTPSLFESEIFHLDNGKITIDQAIYFHTSLANARDDTGNKDKSFFDLVIVNNGHSTLRSYNLSNFFNTMDFDEFLKLTMNKLTQKSVQKSWFMYNDLETFSIPTGFGVDAVYQNKQPLFINLNISYDWAFAMGDIVAQMKLSFDSSANGYSDVSVENQLSQLRHSVRKTRVHDFAISFDAVFKSDFSERLELDFPLLSKNSPKIIKGSSDYISSNVMITDRNGETDCSTCGYQDTTKSDLAKSETRVEKSTVDAVGLSFKDVRYYCDVPETLSKADLSRYDKQYGNVTASTCGNLQLLESDSSVSQIEFKIDLDSELLLSASRPWYFLPGLEFNLEASLGAIRVFDGEVNTLLKGSLILTSSQGNFLNEARYRQTVGLDEKNMFNLCVDVKIHFPNITDNHVPSTVSNSKLVSDFRISFGKSKGETCMELEHGIEVKITGEISKEHVDQLKKYSHSSKCAKQMQNSAFKYPPGSYLMTKHCIFEMISNTTFRRYRIDVKHDYENTFESLIVHFIAIRRIETVMKDILFKKFNMEFDIKPLSHMSEVLKNKTISFQIDSPVPAINKFLPGVYFSQEFVGSFIEGFTTVINVFPKLVLFNNKEMKDLTASLKDWTLIASKDDNLKSYKIYVTLLEDDKLKVKISVGEQQLMLEPLLKDEKSGSNYVPGIFYNGYVDDFAERAFLRSADKILFSLLKVDGYLVIHPTNISVTVYYSVNSVTILQKIFVPDVIKV